MPADRTHIQPVVRKNVSESDIKEAHFISAQQKQSMLPADDGGSVPALLPQDPLAELEFDLGKPPPGPWSNLQADQQGQGPPQPFGMPSADFM